jgi:hypothetical protein
MQETDRSIYKRKEGERDTQTERDTERQIEREIQRETVRDRERDRGSSHIIGVDFCISVFVDMCVCVRVCISRASHMRM